MITGEYKEKQIETKPFDQTLPVVYSKQCANRKEDEVSQGDLQDRVHGEI